MAITWNQATFPLDQFRRDIMVVGLGTVRKASYTAAAAATGAIGSQIVEVVATTDCHIAFDATATTDHKFLPAKQTVYLLVPTPGVSTLSAIRSANDGVLYVTECL